MSDDQPPPQLPDRLYFKIGEVARLVGVKPYVLRYWETEFSVVRPGKTRSKHRLYRRKDVETLLEIRRLLYAERYTIEGAKRRLREGNLRTTPTEDVKPDADTTLARVRDELRDLHRLVSNQEPAPPPLEIGNRPFRDPDRE
ncbi:MAG TPA: MerR family transcriptional regulator [Candidatus Binatia bacterium]|nr:MerR family transcriptional regulator [Candidatus Binatia bacterium]